MPVFWFANIKGADQPAHPCRLISAFVIPFLESIISKLATCKFSIFKRVSEAEETGLSFALLETPKTGFVTSRSIRYFTDRGLSSYDLSCWWDVNAHFADRTFYVKIIVQCT